MSPDRRLPAVKVVVVPDAALLDAGVERAYRRLVEELTVWVNGPTPLVFAVPVRTRRPEPRARGAPRRLEHNPGGRGLSAAELARWPYAPAELGLSRAD